MNPRPLGYEPNELPDCSTPRHESFESFGPFESFESFRPKRERLARLEQSERLERSNVTRVHGRVKGRGATSCRGGRRREARP